MRGLGGRGLWGATPSGVADMGVLLAGGGKHPRLTKCKASGLIAFGGRIIRDGILFGSLAGIYSVIWPKWGGEGDWTGDGCGVQPHPGLLTWGVGSRGWYPRLTKCKASGLTALGRSQWRWLRTEYNLALLLWGRRVIRASILSWWRFRGWWCGGRWGLCLPCAVRCSLSGGSWHICRA